MVYSASRWRVVRQRYDLSGQLCVSLPMKLRASATAAVDRRPQKSDRPRVRFSVDEPISNPTPIPEEVLNILGNDSRVRSCVASNERAESILLTWFVASTIDLTRHPHSGLLVTATNPCLFGANVNPFWIFMRDPSGYRLVFSVPALVIEILPRTTHGSRDIRAEAATARDVLTAIYRFDGKRYRVSRSSRKRI
jgi:hypothetical protein